MYRGGGGPFGIAAITGGNILLDDGTVANPSLGYASDIDTGLCYFTTGATLAIVSGGSALMGVSGTYGVRFRNATLVGWSSAADVTTAPDIGMSRGAAGVLSVFGTSTAVLAAIRRYGNNAGYVEWGSVSENLTLSTGGTTTDTAANLLPADSYIESVTARVTTTVATATSWQVGDATTAGRFTAAQSGAQLTAGATVVGLVHCDVTGAGGPRQTAAAKVRITTVGTPSAGALRLTSFYRTFVAPTS
jgi:hypothetical protein